MNRSKTSFLKYRKEFTYALLFFQQFAFVFLTIAQQLPDTSYRFSIYQAAYEQERGPVIFIDEAHNNFHTKNGGFFAFSKLMEQDGYQVQSLSGIIKNKEVIEQCKILVIANALHQNNVDNWILPTPSAFTKEEVSILREWISGGGSLLLIADHMPFAGAASELGNAIGFEFVNGFAFTNKGSWPPSIFTSEEGTLADSPVSNGLKNYEKIGKVTTFTGSAFKAPKEATVILSFLKKDYSMQPDTAWSFNDKTPVLNLEGYCQGAILKYGKGRIAVFGEAAMFTAQIVNESMKVGFNSEDAPENAQFIINLIHWLDGIEDYSGDFLKMEKN